MSIQKIAKVAAAVLLAGAALPLSSSSSAVVHAASDISSEFIATPASSRTTTTTSRRTQISDIPMMQKEVYMDAFSVTLAPTMEEYHQVIHPQLFDQIFQVISEHITEKLHFHSGYHESTTVDHFFMGHMEYAFDAATQTTTVHVESSMVGFTIGKEHYNPSTFDLDSWVEEAINTKLVLSLGPTPFNFVEEAYYTLIMERDNDNGKPINPIEPVYNEAAQDAQDRPRVSVKPPENVVQPIPIDQDLHKEATYVDPFSVVLEPTPYELHDSVKLALFDKVFRLISEYIREKLKVHSSFDEATELDHVMMGKMHFGFDGTAQTTILNIESTWVAFTVGKDHYNPSTFDLDKWVAEAVMTRLVPSLKDGDLSYIERSTFGPYVTMDDSTVISGEQMDDRKHDIAAMPPVNVVSPTASQEQLAEGQKNVAVVASLVTIFVMLTLVLIAYFLWRRRYRKEEIDEQTALAFASQTKKEEENLNDLDPEGLI